ncbi:MAG: pyrroline-5-carboxylate reductase [Gammaproteobacteria bacterium RIFCSPHIGHO2_12_FULL_63_22]|nr:MAG: pyrroline-5-carboxylate reductase [Gammaproteobacteria bacterium RIFCSPHIGHO2_12_FULL_63_22]
MTQPLQIETSFIGGGNMARSLIGGLLARGGAPAAIHVAEPFSPLREALARDFSVDVHADNADAASRGAVWVFATKPQVLRSVAEALAPIAQQHKPLIISIAAGISSTQLERWLGGNLAVVRAMPNTPALLGAGATGLFANARVDAAQHALAESLMAATGLTAWITDEAQMDAVTGLSGSGPAYVFLLAEAMQAAGEAQGLDADTSRNLALQTILGAARMLAESGEPAAVLRQRVTSPGGTTQAALDAFEAGGFRELVATAIAAATRRGAELSAAHEAPET